MNKTFRKAMLSTICMLVVAVVSLTGVTYAWFSQATYSEVTGLNVQVEAATGGIMIAGNTSATLPSATAYSNTLNLDTTFGSNGGVSPVSTVGDKAGFNFFAANLETPTEITTTAHDGSSVFKYYLFLRNENSGADMHINLGGNVVGEVTQSNPTSISTSGTKAIDDAARLALRYVDTKDLDGVTAETAGSVNGTTGYGIFSNLGTEYQGVKAANATKFAMSNENDTTNLGVVEPVAPTSWDIFVPEDSIVVVELLVWVEGQDAACINANANSTFIVNLIFDRVPEEAAD